MHLNPAFEPASRIDGLGGGGPRRSSHRMSRGAHAAIVTSLALHAAVGVYLWTARFEPAMRNYADEAITEVALVRPVPPPPPPPPPEVEPPPRTPPKPQPRARVQPRPPRPTPVVAPVPPLPIPPVATRVEAPAPQRLTVTPPRVTLAPPPPPPRAPPVVRRPDWLRRPSAADIARYYPDRAQRRGMEGRAVIGCTVGVRGDLDACRVVSETPADAGFGRAAVRMSRHFRMRPMTRDGQPVAGAGIQIPIRFDLPD